MTKQITSYTPEDFERTFNPEGDEIVPRAGAISALHRNAGSFAGIEAFEIVRPATETDKLEEGGCQFVDMTYQLLDYAKVPPHLREIILVICGLSGGDFQTFAPITQRRMSQRMGVGPDYVAERLQELWDWQRENFVCAVDIEKRDRERGVKFETTRYRPVIVRYAGNFIRKLEAKGYRPTHRQGAIEQRIEHVFEETAAETLSEMSELPPMLRGRKERNVTPPQVRLSFIESKEERTDKAFAEWADAVINAGYDLSDYLPERIARMEAIAREKSEGATNQRESIKELNARVSEKANRKPVY